MARSKSPTLTEAELRLMDIVWDLGEATVNDVVAKLPKRRALAYNTVLTTLRILERKGYLSHEKDGRAFVYRPVVDRRRARSTALKYVMSRFFENSPELLVLNILENDKIDPRRFEGSADRAVGCIGTAFRARADVARRDAKRGGALEGAGLAVVANEDCRFEIKRAVAARGGNRLEGRAGAGGEKSDLADHARTALR